jgi:acyl-[acyl-carrier-protein]-phospholipid O-acyltransferase/long-chain-fatty-acid--[acyl-carrier-protein] ligase
VELTPRLVVSHFVNLGGLWRDAPLRRASFGVAFFWGFAAFINLWAVKVAKMLTHGGEGFGTMSSVFLAAGSLGMAAGFGFAALLLRKRIELGWVPLAGVLMTLTAGLLACLTPGGGWFLTALGLLAFSAAVFLAPLNAWMQDRYPADKRGELQSAVNLQDCLAGMLAVGLIVLMESVSEALGVDAALGFRMQMSFIALVCGWATVSIIRVLPGDFIRLIGVAVIRAIYRVRVLHPERIPKSGGVLLLPNHVTYADAFFISAACTRPVRFVMDDAFMASPAIRMFVGIFDTMTIRQDQPLEAIRGMIKALKNGDLVCLFPEGQLTRTGALCELRRGFELTARKAGHPLIPMWCDGSWGSIFSYERSRFVRKVPAGFPQGLSFAFGEAITPAEANLAVVRNRMLEASAAAVANRFRAAGWGARMPRGKGPGLESFRASEEAVRRRAWVNGYQIGQVNGLQRHRPFHILEDDSAVLDLPGVTLTFPDLFGAKVEIRELPEPGVWVGGDRLRDVLAAADLSGEFVFYDFGARCQEPVMLAGVLHLPCLAVNGTVIAMSMPHPPKSKPGDDDQPGHKPGSWGRLLPGWYLGGNRVFGPAAPEQGLELPAGAFADAEGFLCWG